MANPLTVIKLTGTKYMMRHDACALNDDKTFHPFTISIQYIFGPITNSPIDLGAITGISDM